MSAQNFIADLLKEVETACQPLVDSLDSLEDFSEFVYELGWILPIKGDFNAVSTVFNDVSQTITALNQAVTALEAAESGDEGQLSNAISDVIKAIQAVVDAIRTLENMNPVTLFAPLNQADFWKTFPLEVLDLLVYLYLKQRVPVLFGILHFLGILSEDNINPTTPGRVQYVQHSVHWERIPDMIAHPEKLFPTIYNWGPGATFDHVRFVSNVQKLIAAFGLPAHLRPGIPDLDAFHYYDSSAPDRVLINEVYAPFYWAIVDNGDFADTFEIAAVLLPIPPEGSKTASPEGFTLYPLVTGTLSAADLQFNDNIDLSVKGGFDAAPIRVEIRPGKVNIVFNAPTLSTTAILNARSDPPWVLLGNAKSSRIELAKAHIGLTAAMQDSNFEYKIEAGFDGLKLIVDFGEGDGFLQKLLGGKQQSLDLSTAISWSSRTGFGFSGQAALETNIPVHLSIADILSIDTIYIAIRASGDSKALLQVALTGGLDIGPVAATVDGVGLQLELTPRAKTDPPGNLGNLDLGFGFKPPDGLGLLIDAGPVTGGGFISFDAANGRYAGVLQLSITSMNLALTVIGLLDTRLPGGAPGFSFLLIITAQFPRIQLGFGFALTGVGGLAGINRSIVVAALQSGVRNHSVDHILFPKNPVAEATQLISDLRAIFPPTEGQYVFGPMASIVWGTPTIIEAELGIILELPNPIRLVILGQLNAVLPDQKSAIVELHLDIVGVLDFAEKSLGIDATLHDSRLAAFSAYGDMALRLTWGEQPNFALAVGGLHPQFQAPPGFPTLRRLTVALGDGENPRLSLQTYLAITSNSIQIGAHAELYAEAAGFNLYGWIGFDVLIVFPFSFTASLSAGIAFRRGNWVIATVYLSATLTGPGVWHAWGEASISLLFFHVTVHFDATFGASVATVLEVTDPWGTLQAEIGKITNWSITPPPASSQVVTVTAPPSGDSLTTLLDPLGGLTLREKVIPLDRTLTLFGEGKLDQPQRFTIQSVRVGSIPATPGSPLLDNFAPAQFEEMNDAEKLSRPSFERMQAGTTIASDAVLFNVKTSRVDTFTYETIVIDAPDHPSRQLNTYTLSGDHQRAALSRSAAAQSLLRTTGMEKFAPSPTTLPLATLAEEEYVIVDVVRLGIRKDIAIAEPATKGAACQALAQYLEQHPRERGQLEVVPAHEVKEAA
jgi:hypothetical protein